MRIFEVLEATANGAVPGNQTWYRNLYEPLLELGHDVVLFSSREGREAMVRGHVKMRGTFSEKLLTAFRREHAARPVDLFFSYLMDGMVDPDVITQIRQVGVPTCNFSCNNTHQFNLVDELSPYFDYNLHSEMDAREMFARVGATAVWWPMASNPRYFSPRDVARDLPVSFVGMNYASRARYIDHLLQNDVDVHAYGPNWSWGAATRSRSLLKRYALAARAFVALGSDRQYRASAALADHDLRRRLCDRYPQNVHLPVSDDDLIELYSRSKISLGFLEVYHGHDAAAGVVQHLHLRDFEAPMSGALYCTGYSAELADMFDPETEVLTYRNQQELLDKVRFYLAHPELADSIRRAGRERALRDHTYQRRFRDLFARLNLK